jgi:hypothetical protein
MTAWPETGGQPTPWGARTRWRSSSSDTPQEPRGRTHRQPCQERWPASGDGVVAEHSHEGMGRRKRLCTPLHANDMSRQPRAAEEDVVSLQVLLHPPVQNLCPLGASGLGLTPGHPTSRGLTA